MCSICIFVVDIGRKYMVWYIISNVDNGNDKMRKYLFVVICYCNFYVGIEVVV